MAIRTKDITLCYFGVNSVQSPASITRNPTYLYFFDRWIAVMKIQAAWMFFATYLAADRCFSGLNILYKFLNAPYDACPSSLLVTLIPCAAIIS